MSSLPGITQILLIPASSLVDNIAYRAIAGLPVPIYTKGTPLAILGDAVCELSEQPDNGQQLQTVTLTFRTTDTIPTAEPLAFAVRTVQGDIYIIGGKERPHPSFKVSYTTGTPDGDAHVTEYKVTHTHRKALIKCVM